MKSEKKAILMVWPADKIGPTLVRKARDAASFSQWLDAELIVLIAPNSNKSRIEKTKKLLFSQLSPNHHLTIISNETDLVEATHTTLQQKNIGLIILNVEPVKTYLSNWQRELVEKVNEPIILVPKTAKLAPLNSILVPIKGTDSKLDSALAFCMHLATQYHVPLDILHVTPQKESDRSMIGGLSDVFHHEYPSRVDEMIAESSPQSSVEERKMIRNFLHVYGNTTSEILRVLSHYRHGIIALQWEGTFAPGRSSKVKAVLRESPCPILVVKPIQDKESKLQLGNLTIAV